MIYSAILACETQDFASLLGYRRMIKMVFPVVVIDGLWMFYRVKRSESDTYSERQRVSGGVLLDV